MCDDIKDSQENRDLLIYVIRELSGLIEHSKINRLDADEKGITVGWVEDHYARSCHVGSTDKEGYITWDELFGGHNVEGIVTTRARERHEAAMKAKAEADEALRRSREEARDRAEFVRLSKKFADG